MLLARLHFALHSAVRAVVNMQRSAQHIFSYYFKAMPAARTTTPGRLPEP
jgi:hypothetical protein